MKPWIHQLRKPRAPLGQEPSILDLCVRKAAAWMAWIAKFRFIELTEYVGCVNSTRQIWAWVENIFPKKKKRVSIEELRYLNSIYVFKRNNFVAVLSYSTQYCLFGYELMIEPRSAGWWLHSHKTLMACMFPFLVNGQTGTERKCLCLQ